MAKNRSTGPLRPHGRREKLTCARVLDVPCYDRQCPDGLLEVISMEMKNVGGHIEVYDGGKFILSADNLKETEKELEEMEGRSGL
jgi:hypothetical protein